MNKILNILLVLVVLGFLGYKYWQKPKFHQGEQVQDFTSTLLDGTSFTLSDLKGDIILLDFWGSWCGPCRVENPHLKSLYDRFAHQSYSHDQQFHIISVAVETKEAAWRKAIAQDQLNWPLHIAQLDRFNSPIVKQFGVREIPTKYLIDHRGIIIAVNPSFEKISKYLNSQL